MKKILILGVGTYQVPLLLTAKRMGVTTVAASIPGNYPGFELADIVYYENTTDHEAILDIARREKIDGIITAGTDVAVITIGRVCDELGLTGLSYEAAAIATDKLKMKAAYEEHGVRTARFREIYFRDGDYADKLEGLTFPLIFKSVDSSGSRGIVRVDDPSEFDHAREVVRENTRADYFLVEEFIEGEEFGAQAFVQDGKIEFILPHGDYVFKGDTGVPIGHYAPYDLPEEVLEDAREQLRLAIRAMKLDNCAINADFILKDNKTYVLELGGRSGATCLAELVSIYYGYDYYEKILQVALGEKADFTPAGAESIEGYVGTPNASMLIMSDRDGYLRHQEDHNPPDPRIVDVQFDRKLGDKVRKFTVGPHRIGHVITKGETLDEAVQVLHRAVKNLEIQVEPFSSEDEEASS